MSLLRIILVEDEPLVAMMMEDMLADLGCEVAASFGALGAALSWLAEQQTPPDGAVLDVNLKGACQGCMMEQATLSGIQDQIVEALGEFVQLLPAGLLARAAIPA